MMTIKSTLTRLIGVTALCFVFAPFTVAAEFKSANECVAGSRVTNRRNESGKITKVSGTMCTMLVDGTGKEVSTLFWMLHAEGQSQAPSDKLVTGVYKCYSLAGSTLNYMFMDVRITGPDTYEDQKGNKGKYSLAPSGKIVFESGPLVKANAKLLAGPKIGLNMNGGSFFNTTCGLGK